MMTYARGRSGLRIGFLSIAGAISFGVLFFYSTNRALGAVRSTIFVRLPAADGLQRGDAVLHRGVNVGEVKAIDFAGEAVVVRVRLARVVPVNEHAQAAMVAADIFGRQSIVLHDGAEAGDALADGDTLRGEGPVSMTARIEDLGGRVDELLSAKTIEELHGTLRGATSAVSGAATAAAQIGSLASTAEAMIGEQRLAVGDLLRESTLLARDLHEAANPATLASVSGSLEATTRNLASASLRMDSAAVRLNRLLGDLEAGRGTAGLLLRDAALYEHASGSLEALERLLNDVRENPKRYVTIKVF